jgi:hypothetical protein
VQSVVYNVFTRTALIKGTVKLRDGRYLTGFQEPQCAGNVGGASHRSQYRCGEAVAVGPTRGTRLVIERVFEFLSPV